MNPYLVLNVSETSDDQTIRNAYLMAIKRFQPETHPERFQSLNVAYESIKTEEKRLSYNLFDESVSGDSPLDSIRHTMRNMLVIKPLSWEDMQAHLRRSADS